jgi:hypothetical protein
MNIDTVLATLLKAASFLKKPIQDVAAQSVKDVYEAVKVRIKRKLNGKPDSLDALAKASAKPESVPRRDVLREEIHDLPLDDDLELQHLLQHLAKLLPPADPVVRQNVRVGGRGHRVQVAGRDIINAEKHLQKNIITPDERHLSGEQKAKLQPLIKELAERLAGENGAPDYRGVHVRLQRHFNVTSYLLIERADFEGAVKFLKQQRAINRSRLRRRNPDAYRNDFFRAIWARAGNLGWMDASVYAYAEQRLALKQPIRSLKQLGPNQLKSLSEAMERETRKAPPENTTGASSNGGPAAGS